MFYNKKLVFERDIWKMSKKDKKKSTSSEETANEISTPSNEITKNNNNRNNKLLTYFNNHPFKTSVAASIIATIIINLSNVVYNNYILFPSKLDSKLNSLETKLEDLNTPDDIQNTNDSESEILKRIDRLEINVATIANLTGVNLYSDLKYSSDFIEQLSIKSESVNNNYYSSAPPCQNSDIIAINNKNGEKFTKEQLTGEKLLIPYTYNGQEVLFYGQYNENNNWDKDCTINVYENNKLILISETVYDNGIPSSFKQVYPSTTKEKVNVWSITDRTYDKEITYGDTWNYFKTNDYIKNFKLEDATINDILYVSQFENDMKNFSLLEGYYYGKIENGTYTDDDNSESYIIKNDEYGFIRTLYIGNFKDGDFDDHTGKAEEIVFDGTVNRYFHYVGTFTEGTRDGDNLKYITQEEINEIIKPYNFNCELNWRDT